MDKTSFPTQISGMHLKFPELPAEDTSIEGKPSVVHKKSAQKGFDALKNCSETKKTISPETSRRHVELQSQKKSSLSLFGKSLIKNIKDIFRPSSEFTRGETQKKHSLQRDGLLVPEYKFVSPEQTNVNYLEHGLKKFITSENTHNKQQLLFGIKQCFGLADGEPTDENLQKLREIAQEFNKIPEYHHQSKALIQKTDAISEKRKETAAEAAKNMVIAEKQTISASTEHMPSAEPQSLSEADELEFIEKELNSEINDQLDSILKELTHDSAQSPASAKTISSDTLERELKKFDAEIKKILNS